MLLEPAAVLLEAVAVLPGAADVDRLQAVAAVERQAVAQVEELPSRVRSVDFEVADWSSDPLVWG